jgi:hypothetical protein
VTDAIKRSFTRDTRLLLVMTAQVVLSAVFIGGYFYIISLFLKGQVKASVDYKEMVITLLGVLTAGVGMILAFWFQRTRESIAPTQGG